MLDTNSSWTAGALRAETIRWLEARGLPEARRTAEWMLEDLLACSQAHLLAYPERPVSLALVHRLNAMLARRERYEPIQYILGYTDFYGLRLRVTPDVLIPRPETEQVVEAALALLQPIAEPRLLDIGTGSGCIPIALKHEHPDATVYACDISEAALVVAEHNAAAHEVAITFFQADAWAGTFPHNAPHRLDLVISNPPYIPDDEADELAPNVHDYEPHQALFAGRDPLQFYRAIARHVPALLVPGGLLVFETHALHTEAVRVLLKEMGFTHVRLKHDLAGHPRIVHAQFGPSLRSHDA